MDALEVEFLPERPYETRGERLYRRLRRHVRQHISHGATQIALHRAALAVSREETADAMLADLLAMSALNRIMSAARWGRDELRDENDVVLDRYLTDVLYNELLVDFEETRQLLPFVRDALHVSDRPIPNGLRREVMDSHPPACVFCGASLGKSEGDSRLTIEHVWPSSLGGDTDFDNLCPACSCCNSNHNHRSMWTQYWFQDFFLPPMASEKSIDAANSRRNRIGIQFLRASLLQGEHRSLKAALYAVGPIAELDLKDCEFSTDYFTAAFSHPRSIPHWETYL
jgi:hypothetical protein